MKQGPIRGLLALVSGNVGAQLLTVLAMPILTRLYPPASFGAYSYMISVSMVVVSIATLRLELAIPLADAGNAQRLTRMALASAVLWSLLTAIVVAIFHAELSKAAEFQIMPWALWLPLLVLFTSWFVVLSQAALRERAYTAVAKRTLIQGAGGIGGQLVFATVTRSAGGLLSGQLLGRMFGILSLARTNRELLLKPVSGSYGKTLRSYRQFPLVFAPSAVLNTFGTQLPLILVSAWFGFYAAGLLGMAQRVGMIPAGIIGVSVGQVFYGELSTRLRDGEHNNKRLYLQASKHLMLIGMSITIALLTLPALLFPVLFGPNWTGAVAYAQAMAPSIGLGFMVSPLSSVFDAYQKAAAQFALDISRVILVFGLGYWAYHSGWGVIGAIWAMYAGQVVNYVLTWILGLAIVSGKDWPRPRSSAKSLRSDAQGAA